MRLLPAILVAGLAALSAPNAARAGEPGPCAAAIEAAEELRPDFPDHLLTAVSKAETGRGGGTWPERRAWPWTINVDGDGRYYASKAEAVAAVKKLRAQGAGNIDVGCMQISLKYHGEKFDTLAQAFDPAHNVAYALAFLQKLYARHNSWMESIAHYHGGDRTDRTSYRAKVLRIWNAERRASYADGGQRQGS